MQVSHAILAMGLALGACQEGTTNAGEDAPSGGTSLLHRNWWPKIWRTDAAKRKSAADPKISLIPEFKAPKVQKLSNESTASASDQLVITRCRSLLYQDKYLDGSTIHVQCERGVLTLSGTVTSQSHKDRAEKLARSTQGMANVINQIVVTQDSFGFGGATASVIQIGRHPIPNEKSTNSRGPWSAVPTTQADEEAYRNSRLLSNNVSDRRQDIIRADRNVASRIEANNGPKVVLGMPETIQSRPGMPNVVTYMIPREADATNQDGQMTFRRRPVPAPALNQEIPEAVRVARLRIDAPATQPVNEIRQSNGVQPQYSSGRAPIASPPPDSYSGTPVQAESKWVAVQPASLSGQQRQGRSDIDSVLRNDSRYNRLSYTIVGRELVLSGRIASTQELYDLAAKLNQLPNVNLVSYEKIGFDR